MWKERGNFRNKVCYLNPGKIALEIFFCGFHEQDGEGWNIFFSFQLNNYIILYKLKKNDLLGV